MAKKAFKSRKNTSPLSSLPSIASAMDSAVASFDGVLQNLLQNPGIVDRPLKKRINQIFIEDAEPLAIYDEQLARWNETAGLSVEQHFEIQRLIQESRKRREIVASILEIAGRS